MDPAATRTMSVKLTFVSSASDSSVRTSIGLRMLQIPLSVVFDPAYRASKGSNQGTNNRWKGYTKMAGPADRRISPREFLLSLVVFDATVLVMG